MFGVLRARIWYLAGIRIKCFQSHVMSHIPKRPPLCPGLERFKNSCKFSFSSPEMQILRLTRCLLIHLTLSFRHAGNRHDLSYAELQRRYAHVPHQGLQQLLQRSLHIGSGDGSMCSATSLLTGGVPILPLTSIATFPACRHGLTQEDL